MTLGRCDFGNAEGEGIRCRRTAERLREIPGRSRLRTYPVCPAHAEVLGRYFDLDLPGRDGGPGCTRRRPASGEQSVGGAFPAG